MIFLKFLMYLTAELLAHFFSDRKIKFIIDDKVMVNVLDVDV